MIVFTEIQKDNFLEIKKNYQEILNQRNVDIDPIQIKGGFWILPEDVLVDVNFIELRDFLNQFEKREISTDELIVYPI